MSQPCYRAARSCKDTDWLTWPHSIQISVCTIQHTNQTELVPLPPISWFFFFFFFNSLCVSLCVCVHCSLKFKSDWFWNSTRSPSHTHTHTAHVSMLFVQPGTSGLIFSVLWRSLLIAEQTWPIVSRAFVCWVRQLSARIHPPLCFTDNALTNLWEFNLFSDFLVMVFPLICSCGVHCLLSPIHI